MPRHGCTSGPGPAFLQQEHVARTANRMETQPTDPGQAMDVLLDPGGTDKEDGGLNAQRWAGLATASSPEEARLPCQLSAPFVNGWMTDSSVKPSSSAVATPRRMTTQAGPLPCEQCRRTQPRMQPADDFPEGIRAAALGWNKPSSTRLCRGPSLYLANCDCPVGE
jgi:hypothetical protein